MKILVAGWDSGGGVEAVQTVVGRAVARGHRVRVLGTEGLRSRFESVGATFVRYRYAPDNDLRQPETDLVKDWQSRNPSGRSWAGSPGLVLAGLSSTVMRQEGLLQRAADALGQLPARGLVTTGPAVDPAVISAPDNVTVTRWARHADVLPHCSAVITHGRHGTVLKALIAGVPLVLVPLGRDQPDNAARVIHAGAGIRLRKNASTAAIRTAIARVTDDPRYRAAARQMAARLAAERDDNHAVDELEQVAAGRPAPGNPARL